jgi:glucose-6-phosphate 1-dehydrogenase
MPKEPFQKHNKPTAIVIFGGTGDLTQTKLLPSLLDLYIQKLLPDEFVVIGLSRKEMSHEEYQEFAKVSLANKGHHHDQAVIDSFCSHLRYAQGSFDDIESYERIKSELSIFDESISQCTNKLFYLAVPPQFYELIFNKLDESGLMGLCNGEDSWSRLLVEKPFGKDLVTARALEKQLCSLFDDNQIYRIDHYLAKDAIENIIAFRFSNDVIADSWNKEQIESINIRLFETKNVSNRGSFYDDIGTLRDVGQNHMLQILSLLTMPKVDIHNPQSVREARAKTLQELCVDQLQTVTRGQYDGYVETTGVDPNSETETYFKLDILSQSDSWRGVQFVLEAGKALSKTVNEAEIIFKSHDDCNCSYADETHKHNNVLKIVFSPEQKICLSMWVKKPGFDFALEEKELVLSSSEIKEVYSPEAYERVLHDCIVGDQTRFVSGAEVEASWEFITPIMEKFKTLPLNKYSEGSDSSVISKTN